jgi:hypothetical protein
MAGEVTCVDEIHQPPQGLAVTPPLARLEPVDLRVGWTHEAGSFTPWLAHPENLALLGEALGLSLELEGTEVNVGPFRADLLCREREEDHLVLIENQLERTDHSHLGQILTYVAGLGVQTVIWIASAFTEEHRAALDWLNEATDARYHFFGVTLELWRIGASDPAPRFNVVVKPNDWSRTAARTVRAMAAGELSEIGRKRQAYWSGFQSDLRSRGSAFSLPQATAASTCAFSTGRPGLTRKAYRTQQSAGVFLRLHGDRAADRFEQVAGRRAEIEAAFGGTLDWQARDGGAAFWIVRALPCDPEDEADWPRQFRFLEEAMTTFLQILDRIQTLDGDEDVPGGHVGG